MNPKCNIDQKRHGEILGRFPNDISPDEEQEIRRKFPQYLFFRNEFPDDGWPVSDPIRVCTCTACGGNFEAVRGNYRRGKLHHEKCNCPQCGAEVEGIAASKYRYDMRSLESWIHTAVVRAAGDGGLMIEAGLACRRFNQDDLLGEITWSPTKRYYLNRGEVQMWERYALPGCGGIFDGKEYRWREKLTVGDAFAPNMLNCSYEGDYSLVGLEDALMASGFRYCQIDDFYRYAYGADLYEGETARWMMKYLAWYALHPQLEMAVKFGVQGAVHELLALGKKNARLLDWNAKEPGAFLRMSKQDAKSFLKWGLDWDDLKRWKGTAGKLSLTEYTELLQTVGGQMNLKEIAYCAKEAGAGLRQAVRYVTELTPACRHGGVRIETVIRHWKDYLDMARQLGYDLRVKSVAMPKDLKERHDNAAAAIRVQASALEMKRYAKRRRMLEKKYAFRLGELCVAVPTGSAEIIQEGKILHHCVGGYAARHVAGAVTILFIRHWKRPGRPFLTVELYEQRGQTLIRQVHGYRNEGYGKPGERGPDPAERYAWFLGPWLDWVNAGSERDRDGNPVLEKNTESAEVIAG